MDVVAPGPLSTCKAGEGGASASPGLATLADLIEAGHGLTATCEVCLHSAQLDLSDLAARFGADHPCDESALRPLLQCSVCKSTEAALHETRTRRGAVRPRKFARVSAYI